jgi:hypothetical protein
LNAILQDFIGRMTNVEQWVSTFSSTRLGEWNHLHWVGLYQALQESGKFPEMNWGRVNNPSRTLAVSMATAPKVTFRGIFLNNREFPCSGFMNWRNRPESGASAFPGVIVRLPPHSSQPKEENVPDPSPFHRR